MAWTAPSTFVAGAILTAASLNTNVRDNSLAGGPIYATEALRDAAITSPFEGQRAYITGSTVAAATGTTTAVPTGIQTIYNGASWVCVTPVGVLSSTVGTKTTTGYVTTLTGDGTAMSVTLSTGTTALIYLSSTTTNSAAGVTQYIAISFSGATVVAAADYNGVLGAGGAGLAVPLSRQFIVTGLTAGTNIFTLNYNTNSTSTATFSTRSLIVQGVA